MDNMITRSEVRYSYDSKETILKKITSENAFSLCRKFNYDICKIRKRCKRSTFFTEGVDENRFQDCRPVNIRIVVSEG